ncbi:MAG: zinc-dependent peptidase [Cyclobacteriaceae bacterium]|nr:zinc-dependent peptidase [Cyclobacteriaceae bacterium]
MKAALFAAMARLLYLGYQELRFRFYYGPIFHRFLNHRYAYYTSLPWSQKIKFLKLARDHYEYFEFVPRDRIKLTRAMRAIISCAAAQLLLFLPTKNKGLSYFKRIIVYPDYYNSRITNRRHKGEVNPALKTIVFSWRGVAEGLKDPADGINLLLHEFAHALWLEHKAADYDIFDDDQIKAFERYATNEMANLRADENHFFRKYAFDNMEEFFAVAVENFFERPKPFVEAQPRLYAILVNLFQQNPVTHYAPGIKQKPLFR